jgi:hypothetical protein
MERIIKKYSWLGLFAVTSAAFVTSAQASVNLGFDGVSATTGTLVSGANGTTSFTSNGFTWTANMNGDTSPSAAIYYYSSSVQGSLKGYEPVPPSGGGAIYLDGSQGKGTSRGGDGFNQGPSVSVQLNNLVVGQTYTLDFDYNTEINRGDSRAFSDPSGDSKGGVAGLLVGYSTDSATPTSGLKTFLTTDHGPEADQHVPWDNGVFSFTATASTGFVFFIDDNDPSLANERLSSNSFLSDVSLVAVPEISPLVMVGLALIGLVSFQALRKRTLVTN